ncbi:hypothetical protein ACFL0V_05065 [Nanoarchaeota archaeon]
MTHEKKGNLPEKKFRAGAISATVWRNIHEKDGRSFEVRSIKVERNYKDKETDEWKSTDYLRAMDLPKAVVLLGKAYEYIIMTGEAA